METARGLLCLSLLACCVVSVPALPPTIDGPFTRTLFPTENTPTGVSVTTIVARDPDNEGIEFGLIDTSGGDYFMLASTSLADRVDLQVKTKPDREEFPLYEVTVNVSNSSGTLGNMVSFRIFLLDENDREPEFQTVAGFSDTAITISEFSVTGTLVTVFMATDADIGLNSLVRYFIQQPNDGTFVVSELGGVTSVGNNGVHPEDSPYTLCVTAVDQGVPAMSAVKCINVTVPDELDFPPAFIQSEYRVTIPEADYTAMPEELGLTIRAQDDTELSALIRYELVSSTGGSVFGLTETSGTTMGTDIRVTGILDYELSSSITLTIRATKVNSSDGETSLPNFATVSVTLTDVNDNVPTFTADVYHVSIPESDPNDAYVFAEVVALDRDQGTNAVFEYSLLGNACELISIHPVTGALRVCDSDGFDYEDETTHSVIVIARETAVQLGSRKTGTATIVITVVNVNDNEPRFAFPEYTFTVDEEQPAMAISTSAPAVLSAVEAMDDDEGVFGTVTYSISGVGAFTKFTIDGSSAVINTTGPLDRETVSLYHLNLIAEDGGDPPNRAFASLLIIVQDINDNPPVFNPTEYIVTLTENVDYPSFIVLLATDRDEGQNGDITYSIDNPSNFFINVSGSVGAFSLNHEANPSFKLTVTATDRGSTPKSGTACITVTVLGVNEHAPVFTGLPYMANITEDHRVNDPIGLVIQASDPMENHTVTFSISAGTADGAAFLIDPSSGEISLARSLDVDVDSQDDEFTFTVVATDNGAPSPRSSQQSVRVSVSDVNDNAPNIISPSDGFTTSFPEDESTGEMLIDVQAEDPDGSSDGDYLIFTISSMSPVTTSLFSIVNRSASEAWLTLENPLDREMNDTHDLTIMVCDQGVPTPLCDTVDVTINVEDVNDERPMFVDLFLFKDVNECSIGGTSVTEVEAVDGDEGNAGQVVYEFEEGDTGYFFFGVGGDIHLHPSGVDYEDPDERSLSVTISATDNPGSGPQLTSPMNANLTVTVLDCNDNGPVFINAPPYEFTVNETSATHARIEVFTMVDTTDADGTMANRAVVYSITGSQWFEIDRDTGVISIKQDEQVDREDTSIDSQGRGVLTLEITATNRRADNDLGTEMFIVTTTATVYIYDSNDNPPVFADTCTTAGDRLMVAEHTAIGTILCLLHATDADHGTNADITYAISPGTGFNISTTDTGVARLIVGTDLDADSGPTVFMVTITASNSVPLADSSSPATDTEIVTIEIVTANDHTPMFTESRYTTQIDEYNDKASGNIIPNSTVTVMPAIQASDGDDDGLVFSITGGNDMGIFDFPFGATQNPAILHVVRPELIDYETNQEFDLLVTVRDDVVPFRQSTTHLVIEVVNQNDNFPQFVHSEYTGSVTEEQPVGTTVTVIPNLQVIDVDQQNGSESVTITLVQSGSFFPFEYRNGAVITTAPINREVTPSFLVTVEARDSAFMVAVNLTINIDDINDSPPEIQETAAELEVKLPEDFPIGDPIQRVTAVDEDIGAHANLAWHLQGGVGQFEINFTSGVISLTDSLDIEEITEYDLTVTVSDLVNTDSIIVKVTVVNDTNDNDPIFEQSVYEGMILENSNNGTRVMTIATASILTVQASDMDVTSDVTYSLAPGTTEPFDVNETTGEIFVSGSLDREVRAFHTFTVLAIDTVMGSLPDSTIVEVTILDENDEVPDFIEDEYIKDVQENTPASVTILKVTAIDNDIGINANITYLITAVTPPTSDGLFLLHPVTGDVYTNPANSAIDVDSAGSFQIILDIQAEDSGPGNNRDTARVLLSLIDSNDNCPQFEQTHYEFEINETVDGVVGRVNATDPDVGANAVITYSIPGGSGSTLFEINNTTGEITTVNPLNREDEELYTINVEARDNPTTGLSCSTFTTADIRVLDVNDNDPFFDPSFYPIRISEKTSINSTVVQVKAFDVDAGSNAELTYSFDSGDTFAFNIDPSDGTIRSLQTFDYENVTMFTVVVLAVDGGQPSPRSRMATVEISIRDENDNNPQFVHNSTVTVEISEASPVGQLVFMVNVTDADDGFNKEISYTFMSGVTRSGPFIIDRDTGEIFIAETLDRESVDRYELNVIAADQRGVGPDMRKAAGVVTVLVTDINDNRPRFRSNTQTIRIAENLYDGTAAPIAGAFVAEAFDIDIGVNAQLFYHIQAGTSDNCIYAFCVERSTGAISLIAPVDRETIPTYEFEVRVSNSLVWDNDSDSSVVIIALDDVNDNPPIFLEETLLAAVAEEADFGTTVTRLQVTDPDLGDSSVVVYSILTDDAPFEVDSVEGYMTSAGDFSGLSGTRYEVLVEARDNGGVDPFLAFNNTAVVFVFKTNEQVIATFDRTMDEIMAKIDRIEQVLADATGARIIINDVRVHTENGRDVDQTRADVLFFALDRVTGEVLSPETVIQRVDDNYQIGSDIYNLFQECELIEIKAHPQSSSDDDLPTYVWPILAILIALILFTCCCLLCVFVIERRRNRYLRSKKTAASYQSELDQFTSQDYNPVNNPLWVAPYDNWEESTTDGTATQTERDNPLYESQELTIEMFQDDADFDETPAGSRSNLTMKAPPMSHSTPAGTAPRGRGSAYSGADDDELLAEAIGEKKHHYDYDSETSLI